MMLKKDHIITAAKRGFLLLMLGGIFYLSNQPSLGIVPPLFNHQDKVLHTVIFFLLSISMVINRDICRGYHPFRILFAFGVIYAISDEIHQSFIPGRDCSAGDLIADIVGLVIGFLAYFWYNKKHLK